MILVTVHCIFLFQVYLSLIKMYLSPPNMDDYGISLPGGVKPEPNVNAALRVLTMHHDLIDTVKVIILHTLCDETSKEL